MAAAQSGVIITPVKGYAVEDFRLGVGSIATFWFQPSLN
jgi:hypothetical protein